MAKVTARPQLDFRATLEIDEAEARFLYALVGYNARESIALFKAHLGESYIKGHEDAGERFIDTARTELAILLKKFDDARGVFDGTKRIDYTGRAS